MAPDGRSAILQLSRVQIIDQTRWPAADADARPALIDVTIRWTATDEPLEIDDPTKQFRFRGWRAKCQLAASVEVPSIHFAWKSDPMETSRADFALIGEEGEWKVLLGRVRKLGHPEVGLAGKSRSTVIAWR